MNVEINWEIKIKLIFKCSKETVKNYNLNYKNLIIQRHKSKVVMDGIASTVKVVEF